MFKTNVKGEHEHEKDEQTRIYNSPEAKESMLDNKSYCKQDLIVVTYVLKQMDATSDPRVAVVAVVDYWTHRFTQHVAMMP